MSRTLKYLYHISSFSLIFYLKGLYLSIFDIAVTLSYKYGRIFKVTFAVSEDCISFTNFISFGKTEIIIHKITDTSRERIPTFLLVYQMKNQILYLPTQDVLPAMCCGLNCLILQQ